MMLLASVSSILASVYGWFTPGVLFLLLNLVIGGIAFASISTSRHQPTGRGDTGAYAGHYLTRSLSRTPSIFLDHFRSFKLHGGASLEIPDPTAAATDQDAEVSSGNFVVRSLSHSSSIVLDGLRSSFYPYRFGSDRIENPTVAPAAGHEVSDDGRDSTVHSVVRSISPSSSVVLDSLRSLNLHRSPPDAASGEIADEETLRGPETKNEEEERHHWNRSLSDMHPTAGEMPRKLAARIKKSGSEKSALAHFKEAEVEEATREAEEGDAHDEVDARADDFIKRFRNELKLQRLRSILRYKETLTHGT